MKKGHKRKVHSLTGRITDKLMLEAFKAIKHNRGAAGIDKVSIQMFEANLEQNLEALKRDLKTRNGFEPKPLRRVYIPKDPKGTETRPLGIPIVRDRNAQEVLKRLLTPVFEPKFHESSFGFRPNKNCHMAIERVLELHQRGYNIVLDADIKGFFDNIPHEVIMKMVADEVADGNILGIIQRFLAAGVLEDGVFKPTTVGTPQGGVISPLLANIVLNKLDWALHEAGFEFVRYADDFVVCCRTHQQAQEAMTLVAQCLSEIGLELSQGKTRISSFQRGYEFLGFFISKHSIRIRKKSLKKFKDKIRALTSRHLNLDQRLILKLNQVIRGTARYFATDFSTVRWQFQKLDSWIRMRLRCMKKKRKSSTDNKKIKCSYFAHKLGLQCLEEFCTKRDIHGHVHRVIPRYWATSRGWPGEQHSRR